MSKTESTQHFVETQLGWIIGGEIPKFTPTSVCNINLILNTLEQQVQKFWEIEEYNNQSSWSQ